MNPKQTNTFTGSTGLDGASKPEEFIHDYYISINRQEGKSR